MRVYVAGAGAEIERVERVIAAVRAAGHEITEDWTVSVRAAMRDGLRDADLPLARAVAIARHDLYGVRSAEVVLLLAPPPGKGVGCWVELGAALALRDTAGSGGVPRVFVSGRTGNIFCRLADVEFSKDEAAVKAISPKPSKTSRG